MVKTTISSVMRQMGRRGGKAASGPVKGKALAALTPEQRQERARAAADSRWSGLRYRIELGDTDLACKRTHRTLTAARAALRAANGGRLYGRFIPEGDAIEGWNLARYEGCDFAVIMREGGKPKASRDAEIATLADTDLE